MNIRWRISILFLQLIVLGGAAWLITGKPISGETWFFAGLLAVVINPTLLEPYYPRPADVIGNSLISIFLGVYTVKTITRPAWNVFIFLLVVAILLSLFAILFGSKTKNKPINSLARATSLIAREATAIRIYSVVFVLTVIEKYQKFESPFWILVSAWLLILILVSINWQRIWSNATGIYGDSNVEGMIGPSTLLVSATNIPEPGRAITLSAGTTISSGVVLTRIRRSDDVWGQIHLENQKDCEALLKSKNINIQSDSAADINLIGSVDIGSDETQLLFYPTQPLEIGNAVSVIDGNKEILYQISSAKIIRYKLSILSSCQEWWNKCQRRWVITFVLVFDDAKEFCFGSEISDDILYFATCSSVGKEIETSVNHFNRNRRKRFVQRFCNGIGQVNQDRIQ